MTVSAPSESGLAAPQDRLPSASRASDPSEPHTSRSVDASVASLRLQAVEMGGLVIDQVAGAVRALLARDAVLADFVLSRENWSTLTSAASTRTASRSSRCNSRLRTTCG